jgi:hypothetical protein
MENDFSFNVIRSSDAKRPLKSITENFRSAEKTLHNLLFNSGLSREAKPALTPDIKTSTKSSRFMRQQKHEQSMIQKENLRLTSKIMHIRSSLSVKKWNNDYEQSRKYIQLNSKPNSKTKGLRSTSRQDHQRALIDTLNSYLLHF